MTVTGEGKSRVRVLFSLLSAAVQIQVIKGSLGKLNDGSEYSSSPHDLMCPYRPYTH